MAEWSWALEPGEALAELVYHQGRRTEKGTCMFIIDF
jgi:hypothetical protein